MCDTKPLAAYLVCRACLCSKLSDFVLLNNTSWRELYNYCLNLHIKLTSKDTPQYLCKECADLLLKFSEFKQKCIASNKTYKALLKSVLEPVDDKINHIEPKKEIEDPEPVSDAANNFDANDDYYDNDIAYPSNKQDLSPIPDDIENVKKEFKVESSETVVQEKPVRKSKYFGKCHYCDFNAVRKVTLVKHIQHCSQNQAIKCGLCKREFKTNEDLNEHLEEHERQNNLNCGLCEFIGRDFADMVCHRCKHIPKQKMSTCFKCKFKTNFLHSLQFHYRAEHLKLKGGICSFCNKQFGNKNKWRKHEQWHVVSGYICDHCGKKFQYRYQIIDHIRLIEGIKPFICHSCGKRFSRSNNLALHIRIVHTESKPVKCHHCNKYYKSAHSLRVHLRRETNEKTFVCHVCSKAFAVQKEFDLHMTFHTDVRPYVCNYCGSAFKIKSHLNGHMRIHTGERKHKCSFCEKQFGTRSQLKVHESVHTGVRRHPCSYCKRSFNSRVLLRQHCNTKHTDVIGGIVQE